ncbi:MAG: hypothetical protein AB1585_06935 [Thermodesulfobacteriota bacterium]
MNFEVTNSLDALRKSFNGTRAKAERSKVGQFLTPASIARFMGSLIRAGSGKLIKGEHRGRKKERYSI